jgi:hypothetical protein
MHQWVPATVCNLTCYMAVKIESIYKLRVMLHCFQRIWRCLEVPDPVNGRFVKAMWHYHSCTNIFQSWALSNAKAVVDCVWNVMAHAQKPEFVLQRNRWAHLNRSGGVTSVNCWQPRCALSAVVMPDKPCSEVVWGVLATHSTCQFPLHIPSHTSPCAITFQLESTKKQTCKTQM